MEKGLIISLIANKLLDNKLQKAQSIISDKYPHKYIEIEKRSYTIVQKMEQFLEDGFIDRYTGKKLVNPGMLKVISNYFPEEFPYHSHWKMTECHSAYWDLVPTIDHVYPIAKGGIDDKSNWVTTSMKNNSIKSNYTLDEIRWKLYPKGNIKEWDGLTNIFMNIVENDKGLLKDSYIKTWYNVSKKIFTIL